MRLFSPLTCLDWPVGSASLLVWLLVVVQCQIDVSVQVTFKGQITTHVLFFQHQAGIFSFCRFYFMSVAIELSTWRGFQVSQYEALSCAIFACRSYMYDISFGVWFGSGPPTHSSTADTLAICCLCDDAIFLVTHPVACWFKNNVWLNTGSSHKQGTQLILCVGYGG